MDNDNSTVFGDFESQESPKHKQGSSDMFSDKPIDF